MTASWPGPLMGARRTYVALGRLLLVAGRRRLTAGRGARAIRQRTRIDAALAGDLVHRRQMSEAVHRRAHHVVRIRRAEALREDVVDAGAFHDGANGATGDHAGARCRGLHENLSRAMLADH